MAENIQALSDANEACLYVITQKTMYACMSHHENV
jgi:hypothetical protein